MPTSSLYLQSIKPYHIIGSLFFLGYLGANIASFRPDFVENWLSNENYKLYSGFFIASIILLQWLLFICRALPNLMPKYTYQVYQLHHWLGAFLPAFFFFHTNPTSYNYLYAFSIVFSLNIITGLIPIDWFLKQVKLRNIWLFIHLSLSILLLTGIFIHVFTVFYFE